MAESPHEADRLVADALAGYLSTAWADEDAPPGLVRRVIDGCRYESYLWVMGDRRWSQLADTLAGRLHRRRVHPAGGAAAGSPAGR